MDLKEVKELIVANLGLVLALTVPLATVVYQKKTQNNEVTERKSRGLSFHRSESFMELQNAEANTSGRNQAFISFGLEQPLVIAMVGLPARGKSYIVNMIIRYLKWIGFEAKVFNVGSYRRKMGLQSAESNFFDANNEEGKRVREELAMAVQDSMYEWLHSSKDFKRRVAIFDATNTTIKRRLSLAQRAREHNVALLFVESICNDQEVLKQNYSLKLQNEDYKGMDPEKARRDFMDRVHAYEKVYEVSAALTAEAEVALLWWR
jgi:predicted kinase